MTAEARINMDAVVNILDAIESFFRDSGCPLTDEQRAALTDGPRSHAAHIEAKTA